jgi:hypothetical protein
MTMPKTTVHKDNRSPLFERQIGTAGKIFAVQPETKSHAMSGSPDEHLGRGILVAYRSHHCRAFFFGNRVDQGANTVMISSWSDAAVCAPPFKGLYDAFLVPGAQIMIPEDSVGSFYTVPGETIVAPLRLVDFYVVKSTR